MAGLRMSSPAPRKRRGPIAARLLALDAWIDSTLYEIGFKAGQFWESATIFFRRFRVKGWRRGIIELLSEGFTLGAGGSVLMLALAMPAFQDTAGDWRAQGDFAVTFLDRYGNEIGQRGIIQRDSVPVDEMPDHVIKAVLATEDRRFFEHYGIDFLGLMRAIFQNVRANSVVQGGSSITQQLAKNLFLTNERTFERKIKEAFLSVWLEANLSKKEILQLYLDRAYMGGGTFGIEAAGFEVRDRIVNLIDPDDRVIAFLESLSRAQADALFRLLDQFGSLGEAFWCFGSGFPKSHDVSKAIDKLEGFWRGRAGAVKDATVGQVAKGTEYERTDKGEPITAAAAVDGWGTALKPAYEPIVIARKPLAEHSVARQVLKTGTGALNIAAARIGDEVQHATFTSLAPAAGNRLGADGTAEARRGTQGEPKEYVGRWPANLTHDGCDVICGVFPGDEARFFYTSKADAHDRIGSGHPTVKPLDLMQWLCRMLTPPGGVILDLFAGSGSTGEAAYREGFKALLIEREPEYQADIARRMENATAGPVGRRHAATRAKLARRAKQAAAPHPVAVIDDMFGAGGAASDGGIFAQEGGFGFRRRKP